jgi:hypothetical protein
VDRRRTPPAARVSVGRPHAHRKWIAGAAAVATTPGAGYANSRSSTSGQYR